MTLLGRFIDWWKACIRAGSRLADELEAGSVSRPEIAEKARELYLRESDAGRVLEEALAPLWEAFSRWCEREELAADLGAPHGQAFEAGWNAAIRKAVEVTGSAA